MMQIESKNEQPPEGTGVQGVAVMPVFPCRSLEETLTFYRALGFAVTYEQTSPYEWSAVQWRGIDLDFYGYGRGFNAEKNICSCIIMAPDVTGPYQAFVAGLRQAYGRLPTAGLPRITRLRPGQTRFGLFDPAGNSILLIAWDEPPYDYGEEPEPDQSRLAQALATAVWLRDWKGFDDVAAARVLDKALARNEPAPALDLARVLAARAELALALGETKLARALRAQLQQTPLTTEERERYRDELQAADELEQLLVSDAL
jgi:catechol 2,3-dioxygenase-like lactoylglutathione lyase family enzyme